MTILHTGMNRRAMLAGADGVLVGTAILQAADPAAFISRLIYGGRA